MLQLSPPTGPFAYPWMYNTTTHWERSLITDVLMNPLHRDNVVGNKWPAELIDVVSKLNDY